MVQFDSFGFECDRKDLQDSLRGFVKANASPLRLVLESSAGDDAMCRYFKDELKSP